MKGREHHDLGNLVRKLFVGETVRITPKDVTDFRKTTEREPGILPLASMLIVHCGRYTCARKGQVYFLPSLPLTVALLTAQYTWEGASKCSVR